MASVKYVLWDTVHRTSFIMVDLFALSGNNPVYQWLQEALEMNPEELHDYGLGLEAAISWESALHHSLMPVTPHRSITNREFIHTPLIIFIRSN